MKRDNLLWIRLNLAARFSEGKGELHQAGFLKEQERLLERILEGESYFGATYYVPGEITAMFDVPVVYMERLAGFGAANRLLGKYGMERTKPGMAPCGCTYQLMFESMIDRGIIPPPSGFLAASYACDDAWMYCRLASEKYDVPVYFIDVPRTVAGERLLYLSAQLEKLYEQLKASHPQILTVDEVIAASNEAIRVKGEIDRLRSRYPGIIDSTDSLKLFTLYNDLGKPEALKIFKALYSLAADRVNDYQKLREARLLWLGVVPLFQNSLLRDIENKYSCRIVYEELFDYGENYLSKDSFFIDLSKRIVSSIFFTAGGRADRIKARAMELKAEGIIHFSQRNCRFLPPMLPVLRDRLEGTGIPIVEIQGDAIDPGGFDEGLCWERLEPFFEIVDRRHALCI